MQAETTTSPQRYNPAVSATLLNRIAMILSFGGVFVAGTLTLAKAMNKGVPCGVDDGCDKVANHSSAIWFGQPVAYYGLAAYLLFAFLSGMRSANGIGNSRGTILFGTIMAAGGTILSGY